ncbi:hypothetical protein [Novipirellula aureliae]|uniref:hypothetical protein n=1 Tax=Novipirellula aureliae TaxID=2527966 RepID=UPI0011B7CA62|nr:hypothetical protein [Novipirellula aureliae]
MSRPIRSVDSIEHFDMKEEIMRRLFNLFAQARFTQPCDPRTMDPMSMTLHDVIRLVEEEQHE